MLLKYYLKNRIRLLFRFTVFWNVESFNLKLSMKQFYRVFYFFKQYVLYTMAVHF